MALGLLGILGLGGVGAGIAGGLGYGFGIRYGFERIFPSFQQGGPQKAIQTAASDIAQLLGTEGFDAGGAETDTFLGNLPDDPQLPFDPSTGGGKLGPPDIIPEPERIGGAEALKDSISNITGPLTDPLSRQQKVHFKNYKDSTEDVARFRKALRNLASINLGSKTSLERRLSNALDLQKRSFSKITSFKWWPSYYNWLKTFT